MNFHIEFERGFQSRGRSAKAWRKAQMKTKWDSYLDQKLSSAGVRHAYEKETKVLSIGPQLD